VWLGSSYAWQLLCRIARSSRDWFSAQCVQVAGCEEDAGVTKPAAGAAVEAAAAAVEAGQEAPKRGAQRVALWKK
jgi:hypothetical protein